MIINYYKIVPIIDILGFVVSIFTFIRSCKNILINKAPIISFANLPFISLLISISFVFDFMGIILDKKDFFFISKLISGSMICYVLILEWVFPILFGKITNTVADLEEPTISEEIQADRKHSSRNLLEGVDLNSVEIKLNQFITSKGFKDEELRLPDFATDLGLSTHQASYYLNNYLSKSYNDFLNFHRMNEVMTMIRTQSNFNLLSIALECGFNSPSSFHRACIKFTGKSPRDLRKDILLHPNKDVILKN
ncbi:helix-turn-helix domain-containing protein [Leptospira borgpetersenii]|nr:helix-turn-helix domain-containing protein [Leptospira borgpetersenii]ALO26446.1 DNA-binding helix-turn-helix protein [Leptospira borgpetersenii serovar Ballum]ANH01069.1 DNA-binding helix-turn-helix protein [Leptospira borgpetersenii str. 4E]KGE21695.1 DNA-binding protein [Leptospira borgpetersenii serovar Ballum]MBE8161809.1 AraC family transcriptional regulator [Leptospira borgpetersenii serovar Ballum]MBE8166232.1 AraC family transcriptional regulator [Leptospira borgpetersenii serovar 